MPGKKKYLVRQKTIIYCLDLGYFILLRFLIFGVKIDEDTCVRVKEYQSLDSRVLESREEKSSGKLWPRGQYGKYSVTAKDIAWIQI